MNRILIAVLALLMVQVACKKEEDDTQYNLIQIISGSFDGQSYQFEPNKGYVAAVNQSTNSYRLVFGSTDQAPELLPGIMDIFFYNSGGSSVLFPSAEGQMLQFRLMIDGQDCSFNASDVVLNIHEVSETHMKGSISGDFTNSCEPDTPAGIEMNFSIEIESF